MAFKTRFLSARLTLIVITLLICSVPFGYQIITAISNSATQSLASVFNVMDLLSLLGWRYSALLAGFSIACCALLLLSLFHYRIFNRSRILVISLAIFASCALQLVLLFSFSLQVDKPAHYIAFLWALTRLFSLVFLLVAFICYRLLFLKKARNRLSLPLFCCCLI
ncbi:hypothetical protein, partial [Pseudoalteromonas tunicata]